jgi:hypothetical protein
MLNAEAAAINANEATRCEARVMMEDMEENLRKVRC